MKRAAFVIVVLSVGCATGMDAESDEPIFPPGREPRGDASGDETGSVIPGGDAGFDANDGKKGWHALGAGLATGATSTLPALAIDAAGAVVLARTNGANIEVARFDGTTWQPVGAAMATGGAAYPSIAAGATSLYVAWHLANKNHVREWNGSSWTTPGGTPLGTQATFLPHVHVAIGADGKPWVTFNEHTSPSTTERVYVYAQNDAVSWIPRGAALGSGPSSALAPELATGGGKTFAAYEGNGVHVHEWSGSTWVELGAGVSPPPGGGFTSPSTVAIAADGMGRPVVAYHAYLNNIDGTLGFVARWNGASWTHLGGPIQAKPGQVMNQASYTTMQSVAAASDGTVYVAITEVNDANEHGVHVYRCSDAACAPLGRGRLDAVPGSNAHVARLAVDHAGRPVVAFAEKTAAGNDVEVHVWRYHGDPDSVP